MLYTISKKINNVDIFKIVENKLFYISDNEIKNTDTNVSVYISEYFGIAFNSTFFNVFTNNSHNTFYNYSGKIIKIFNQRNFYYYFSEDSYIYYDRISKTTKYNDKTIVSNKLGKKLLYADVLFFVDKNYIQKINFLTENSCWQFSLSSLGKFKNIYTNEEETIEVRQFIGVYNNILWLFLNKTGFIGLDITTGNLKHHIQKNDVLIGETAVTSYTENENGSMSFFRSQYYLDEQKGKIIGLAVDMLFEMDLNRDTPFVTQYGLQKQYQKYGINEQNIANDFILKDNLLYFYAFNQLKFGILNIKTKEVIYISEPIIPENNKVTQLKDLQVSDNKVYILDSGNTLHIFEKEK